MSILRVVAISVSLSIALFCSASAGASELANSEKVVALLEKNNLLSLGRKVVAKVSGNEVTVSTYRHKESKDKDNDCKIDATLIAKELMISNDFGLRRVIVNFHEPDLIGNYREVIVSYAEIKGFASGAVQQADFLSSITLNLVPEAINKTTSSTVESRNDSADAPLSKSASTGASIISNGVNVVNSGPGSNKEASSETGKDSNSQLATSSVGTSPPGGSRANSLPTASINKEAAKPRYVSAIAGISFDIPRGWSVEDRFPPNGGLFFKLHSSETKMSNIEFGIRRSGERSPGLCALAQKKRFSYDGVKFEKYESTKFGQGKYDGALIVLQYPHNSNEQYYDMHLYFGKANAILDMWGWCPVSQYSTVGAAFYEVMNSMSFPSVQGQAAANKGGVTVKKGASKHR